MHDQQRLIRLLTNTQRPVQIIIAGKAHPQDEQGKRFIQAWAQFVRQPEVRRYAVFLEDYDMALAQELVHGVDVWINTPRRPWEACGASGMKVLVNGGLNLSELDGWWAEAYNKEVGWVLGNGEEHQNPDWDGTQAKRLYQLLEEEIIPTYYDRDAAGIPRGWVTRLRASMAQLAPQYSTNRMMREYVERMCLPVATAYSQRQDNSGQLVKTVCAWEQSLKRHWQGIHFGNLEVAQEEDGWAFLLQVYLGDISPASVQVQLYADSWVDAAPLCQIMEQRDLILGAINGYIYYGKVETGKNIEEITPRVVPYHPDVFIPIELPLICWKE